jgi:hypothetical protein
MSRRRKSPGPLVLVALALAPSMSVAGCAAKAPPDPFQAPYRFQETGRAKNTSRLIPADFPPGLAPAVASMLLMCDMGRLTLDRGFRYFHVHEFPYEVGPDGGELVVEFFMEPPAGFVVIPGDAPDAAAAPNFLRSAVVEAEGLMREVCDMFEDPEGR